jgi:hypothetical protein
LGLSLSPLFLEKVAPHGTRLRLPFNPLLHAKESPPTTTTLKKLPMGFFYFKFIHLVCERKGKFGKRIEP